MSDLYHKTAIFNPIVPRPIKTIEEANYLLDHIVERHNYMAEKLNKQFVEIERASAAQEKVTVILASSPTGGGGGGTVAHNLLSVTHPDTLPANPNLGDIIAANATPQWQRVGGNASAVKQFLTQTGSGVISAIPVWGTIAAADVPASALTKTDDTNVTLTLGGTPASSLLAAVSLTLGWTGTLAAARLNANVVQSVVNDTNVTGSIAAQGLTLGWTGTLAIARGGTGQGTALAAFNALSPLTTKGDLLSRDGTNNIRVPVGADTFVLTADSAQASGIKWAAGGSSPLTTKGDIYVFSTVNTRLPVGTDGQFLSADSTQATGLKWVSSTAAPHTILSATHTDTLADTVIRGDLIVGNVTPKWSRLAIGASTKYIRSDGTDATWQFIVAADITAGAALTKTDDTNVTLTLGGSPTVALLAATSLTLGWTGTLAVSRGGIGVGTLASNGVLYGNGTGAVLALAVNATATNKFLTQVSSGAPAWNTILASDLPGSFSGFAVPVANSVNVSAPTAGAATTAIRSDATLQLDQSIIPTWTGLHTHQITDAVVSATSNIDIFQHRSSGTPLAGFAGRLLYQLKTSTTNDRDAIAIDARWTTPTEASQTSVISFYTVTAAAALTEMMRLGQGLTVGASPTDPGTGVINAIVGFRVNGAAASGNWLGGNGTNFISTVAGALTKTDDTNVTLTLGGTPSTALLQAASLTLGWTGTLAVSRGGIGVGTLALNGVLYGNGTSAVLALAVNSTATNKFLTQVSSGAPAWNTIVAGDLPGSFSGFANPSVNVTLSVQNGVATTAMRSDAAPALSQAIAPTWTATHIFQKNALGSTSTDAVAIVDATVPVSNGEVQMSPRLRWSGGVKNSQAPLSAHTVDWIAEVLPIDYGLTWGALFQLSYQTDAGGYTTNFVLTAAGHLLLGSTTDNATIYIKQAASTSGSPTGFYFQGGTHTTLANAETLHAYFDLTRTVQFAGNATLSIQRAVAFDPPRYSSDTATKTITTAATVAISNAAVASTNVVITKPCALWVQAGQTLLQGNLVVNPSNDITNSVATSWSLWLQRTTAVSLGFLNNSAAVDTKLWYMTALTTSFIMGAENDAGSIANNFIKVTRSGATISDVRFPSSGVFIGNDTAPLSRLEVNGVIQHTRVSPSVSETIDTNYGATCPTSYTLSSGYTLTLNSGAVFMII